MATAKSSTKKVPALSVVSRSPMGTFRRAGRAFGTEPTIVPLAELKKGEAEALKAEPMLIVTSVEIDVADEETKKLE